MSRLMALDLGEKRIGVALSDPGHLLAFPDRVLRRTSARGDRRLLTALVQELRVSRIIVGLPLSLEGAEGPNAAQARSFGAYLERTAGVPVEFWDERLTTVEADNRLRDANVPADQRRKRIDAVAAAVILEDYLRAQPA